MVRVYTFSVDEDSSHLLVLVASEYLEKLISSFCCSAAVCYFPQEIWKKKAEQKNREGKQQGQFPAMGDA